MRMMHSRRSKAGELVDQNSASWNQLAQWLRQIGVIQTGGVAMNA
jgi:hypothetical protein